MINELTIDEIREFHDPCYTNEYPFIPFDIIKLENNVEDGQESVIKIGEPSNIGNPIGIIGYPGAIDNSRPHRYKNTPIVQPIHFLSKYVPNWKSAHPGIIFFSNQHYITYKASTVRRNSGSLIHDEEGNVIGIHINSRDDVDEKSMNYVCGIRLDSIATSFLDIVY